MCDESKSCEIQNLLAENDFRNPFCKLTREEAEKKCNLTIKECINKNRNDDDCEYFVDDLSEEQRALRNMEIERLEKIRKKCEKRIERLEKIKKAIENNGSFIANIGCFGCLLWIALLLVCLAGGIYAIRWAWWLVVQAWSCTI